MPQITIDYEPNAKQYLMHASDATELFYGGAKGGGKSKALVMDALAYGLQYPGCYVGLFRESYAILDANLIREWKKSVPQALYTFSETKHQAILPNGSLIQFRYVSTESDAASYQGQEFDYIGIDELTKHTERTVQLLLSCLRSAKGYPVQFRGTGNPGGRGHGHVKRNFIEPTEYGKKPFIDPITGNKRVFIPAQVYDNTRLMEFDPNYARRLENLPEQERKAFLDGNWDVFLGQVFSEWRRDEHVIEPFEIPKGWARFRAFDWGFAKPYSIHWYAVDYDGVIYVYRELYGMKRGQPDVGTEEDPYEVACKVKESEAGETISYGVADPSIWQKDARMKKSGNGGESVAETFSREGINWIQADNARILGKMQVHARLRGHGKGKPGVKVFSTCTHFIRTIPELCYDENKVEDVDTTLEDHAYDEFRYACMSRPWIPTEAHKQKPRDYNYRDVEEATGWMAG